MISYKQQIDFSEIYLLKKIEEFLLEDIPDGDKTSMGTVSENAEIIAEIQAVENLIFSGEAVIKDGPTVPLMWRDPLFK